LEEAGGNENKVKENSDTNEAIVEEILPQLAKSSYNWTVISYIEYKDSPTLLKDF